MGVFDIDQVGDVVVIVPQTDLNEFHFEQIEEAGAEVLNLLETSQAKSIVVDFHLTDYYGSTAIGFFVKLWKRVRDAGGTWLSVMCRPTNRRFWS